MEGECTDQWEGVNKYIRDGEGRSVKGNAKEENRKQRNGKDKKETGRKEEKWTVQFGKSKYVNKRHGRKEDEGNCEGRDLEAEEWKKMRKRQNRGRMRCVVGGRRK